MNHEGIDSDIFCITI